MNIEQERKK